MCATIVRTAALYLSLLMLTSCEHVTTMNSTPAIPDDVAHILGKDIRDISANRSAVLLEVDDSLRSNPMEPLPSWARSWLRTSITISQPVGNLRLAQLLTIGITPDKQIWYVQVPVFPSGVAAPIGPVGAGFTFADCSRVFGRQIRSIQYAPAVRIDWWNVDGRVVRIASRTMPDAMLGPDLRKVGGLEWVLIYDHALAPAQYRGGYDWVQ